MEEQVLRTITGELKVLENKNRFILPVEIKALNSEVNRNGWKYINLEEHLKYFAQIPLLTAYNMGGAVIGGGHQYDEKIDPKTGEKYVSFTAADAERIVGWVGDNAARIENIDGVDWVTCSSSIWSWYAPELSRKLSDQGRMSVSIETLVTKEHIEGDIAIEEEYIVLGITLLGDGVQPAVENAAATVKTLRHLSEIRDGMKEEIMKAASYIEDENNEPVRETQTESRKGVNNLNYFSKKQCAELSKRFDGYTVLAAAQDDKGIHVALLSKDGDTARYEMKNVDETIAVEKIMSCNGIVTFDCDNSAEGNCFSVGLDAVMDGMNEVIEDANANCKNAQEAEQKANEALNTAMATIAEMRKAEAARRVKSAKECAANTLKAFNQFAENAISEKVLEAINKDIDEGMYTEKVNADGAWIGESEVELRVKALCLDEVQKLNKANAEKNKSVLIWDKLNSKEDDHDTVGSLLRRKGIRE